MSASEPNYVEISLHYLSTWLNAINAISKPSGTEDVDPKLFYGFDSLSCKKALFCVLSLKSSAAAAAALPKKRSHLAKRNYRVSFGGKPFSLVTAWEVWMEVPKERNAI
ncbi:hypothetical protein CEXT_335871 [Caerostris extrusa]|uniref:Uncharacterized protein n=1 Tax=Caerostris extrusa TaxID=172846 RepID=A0AAV4M330_CAEEX|nr:hypothetical protein CEXT_335871 [Caerostris extrusa]